MSPLEDFQRRQEEHEPSFVEQFLQWIARIRALLGLHDTLTVPPIVQAIRQATPLELPHHTVAEAEAAVATSELPSPGLEMRFDIRDPNFQRMVHDRGAQAITDIDTETRSAVQLIVADAYNSGLHPREFASHIAELVGLTTRQALAVSNQRASMLEGGMTPELAVKHADAYAARLLKQRAMTIARTETIAAANLGRVAAYQQAQRNGFLPKDSSWLEWMSVQDDPNEICFELDGERWPVDAPGPIPPIHPNCRCVLVPVMD